MLKYMARNHAKSGRKLGRIETHYIISTTYDGKPLRNLVHKCQYIMIVMTNYSKRYDVLKKARTDHLMG